MELYYRVSRDIAPKRQRLAEAEAIVAATRADLIEKERALAETEARLRSLTDELARITTEKQSLQQQITSCETKLNRANKLMNGLGGERIRWAQAAVLYAEQAQRVLGDSLLASAMVAYTGPYTQAYRTQIIDRWSAKLQTLGIEVSPDFSLRGSAGDAVMIRDWVLHGLPNDNFSVDNAIIFNRSRRWPLCIDPQGQVRSLFYVFDLVLLTCLIGK